MCAFIPSSYCTKTESFSFIKGILLPHFSAEETSHVSVTVKYCFEILFSLHGNLPDFFFFSICIFAIFVVPRAVKKYEAGIMNHIFCKQSAVIGALAFAYAIDPNTLCTDTPDSDTLWLNYHGWKPVPLGENRILRTKFWIN